ncbi:MAG: recombinase family protein [Mycobacteriales bacterium]
MGGVRNAGVYVRTSHDPTGARLGVKRQSEDCHQRADALGWHVAAVYEDNDVSASTGATRPAYKRMLGDIAAGRITAVVVWDLDRLTRRPIEVEDFIGLADRHGVALASIGGDCDLSTDNGRMFARIKGAVARAEIERKSARQKRANLQRAQAGRPSAGRRPFGYSGDRMAVVEGEAAEVRKAAAALVAGSSLRGIVADMTRRGVRTTLGGPWQSTQLRRVLSNPRYAGLLVYRGEVLGKGTWPAIVDEDTFYAARAMLSDPARRRAGPPRQHMLSGIARCAVCGGRLFGVSEKGKGTLYRCESRRHVQAKAAPVDALVLAVITRRLSRPDAIGLLAAPERTGEATGLRDEDMRVRERLDGLAEAFAAAEIDRRQLAAGSARSNRRLDEIARALADLSHSPVLTGLATAVDVEEEIQAMYTDDLDRLRAVIAYLVDVTLHPAGRGARTFRPESVRITWKGGK